MHTLSSETKDRKYYEMPIIRLPLFFQSLDIFLTLKLKMDYTAKVGLTKIEPKFELKEDGRWKAIL